MCTLTLPADAQIKAKTFYNSAGSMALWDRRENLHLFAYTHSCPLPLVFGAFEFATKTRNYLLCFWKCRSDVFLINTHVRLCVLVTENIFGGILDLYLQMTSRWKDVGCVRRQFYREYKLSLGKKFFRSLIGIFWLNAKVSYDGSMQYKEQILLLCSILQRSILSQMPNIFNLIHIIY